MKRKIITAILAITVVFSAASCGSAENTSSNTQEATVSDMQNSTDRVSEAEGDTQSEEMTATVNDGENLPGAGTSTVSYTHLLYVLNFPLLSHRQESSYKLLHRNV